MLLMAMRILYLTAAIVDSGHFSFFCSSYVHKQPCQFTKLTQAHWVQLLHEWGSARFGPFDTTTHKTSAIYSRDVI